MQNERKKLSNNSLLIQVAELDTLKKQFDMLYLSKGQIYISSQLKTLKTRIDCKLAARLAELNQSSELLSKTKIRLVECLNENRDSLLSQLAEEKTNLVIYLDKCKEELDEEYVDVKAELDCVVAEEPRHQVNVFVLRENLMYLKQKLRNYIQHFSILVEFRLFLVEFNDENTHLIGELDKCPNRYFFGEDILKRVVASKPKTVRINTQDELKHIIPLKNHNVLVVNVKNELKIYNFQSKLRFVNLVGAEKRADSMMEFVTNDNFIFVLCQNREQENWIEVFDYELRFIRAKTIPHKETANRFECFNNEIFLLRSFPARLNSKIKPFYEIFDEDLKEGVQVSPAFFVKENLAGEPELVGATKDTLFIAVSSHDSAIDCTEVLKSIRLVSRDTGLEISRLDNYLFGRYEGLYLTDEYGPRVLGVSLNGSRPRKEQQRDDAAAEKSVYKMGLFNASNGSTVKEVNFGLKSLSLDKDDEKHRIRFLSNGFFGLSELMKRECYFF
jgi:hypothetical protein